MARKSICLNFGIAQVHQGQCNLRFDDTNPVKEDIEYVESIKNDAVVRFPLVRGCLLPSIFDQLHQYAVELIKQRRPMLTNCRRMKFMKYRGSLKAPKNSPYRDRSVERNGAV